MDDVDAILASGRYTDRRGRAWRLRRGPSLRWVYLPYAWGSNWLTPDQMRTLIERDRHRAVCPGLRPCNDHPVAHVYRVGERTWFIYGPEPHMHSWEHTFGAALDAARHMAGAA